MVFRWRFVTALVGGAGLLAGLAGLLRGDLVTPSAFIFRSEEELLALREILRDETAGLELRSLSERLALWRTGTASEEPGAGGPTVVHGLFEFATRRGVSSRVYRVVYRAEEIDEDALGRPVFEISRVRAGFGSDFERRSAPLLGGETSLRVLTLALEDPGVSQTLVDMLGEQSIEYCRVIPEGTDPVSEDRWFRFLAVGAGDGSVLLEYDVRYDPEEDAAEFLIR